MKLHTAETAHKILVGLAVMALGGVLLSLGLMGRDHHRAPKAPVPVVLTHSVPAPTVPPFLALDDCEDNGGQAPCWTIDEGHWIVVISYHPYRAWILDDMAALAGGDIELGA